MCLAGIFSKGSLGIPYFRRCIRRYDQWLALKPPGLLAFPVATAVFYLLPLVLVFAYGVLSFLKVEQMYPAVA